MKKNDVENHEIIMRRVMYMVIANNPYDYEDPKEIIELMHYSVDCFAKRLAEERGTLESKSFTTGARPAVFEKFSDLLCAVSTLARSLANHRSRKG